MKKLDAIRGKLKDERGDKVIFVSHCILNTNTRYFGGAFRPGTVNEIVEQAVKNGIGIIQMDCPEQIAWGGLLKPMLWVALKSDKKVFSLIKAFFLPVFIFYTRLTYRRIAARTAESIIDYTVSGYTVKGVIGVDGSPSCGVNERLDMKKSFRLFSDTKLSGLSRADLNRNLYGTCLDRGNGIFMEELKKQLEKRKIQVNFDAHSLVAEMEGKASPVILGTS